MAHTAFGVDQLMEMAEANFRVVTSLWAMPLRALANIRLASPGIAAAPLLDAIPMNLPMPARKTAAVAARNATRVKRVARKTAQKSKVMIAGARKAGKSLRRRKNAAITRAVKTTRAR